MLSIKKPGQDLFNGLSAKAAGDENDAGRLVFDGIHRQGGRWVEDVLHAVNGKGLFMFAGVNDAFDAQQGLASVRGQHRQGKCQSLPGNRLIAGNDKA